MMKSLVVYYSHFGNTAHVAEKLFDAFAKYGEVNIFELQYREGKQGLLRRILYRLAPALVNLYPPPEAKDFDVICICMPVRAGYPPPPVLKYVHTCEHIDGKKIICCNVYGIEKSARSCFKHVKKNLQKRGNATIIDMYVPWMSAYNEQFLDKAIKEMLVRAALKPA